jgi:hypothetical protein
VSAHTILNAYVNTRKEEREETSIFVVVRTCQVKVIYNLVSYILRPLQLQQSRACLNIENLGLRTYERLTFNAKLFAEIRVDAESNL